MVAEGAGQEGEDSSVEGGCSCQFPACHSQPSSWFSQQKYAEGQAVSSQLPSQRQPAGTAASSLASLLPLAG